MRVVFTLITMFLVAGAAASPSSDPPSRTVGILGASLSAGFGMHVDGSGGDGPAIVGVRLADLVLALAPRDTVVSDWSTSMFFRSPSSIGPRAVERLAEISPDVILAIDFLFWFAYGEVDAEGAAIRDEAQRERLFESGLALLDAFEAPIVVGDLPDMRGASRRMLSERQVPAPATIARLNARLREWAASRELVTVLPLESIRRRELAASPDEQRRRLQPDRLHPTFEGLVAILAEAAPTLETLLVVVPDSLTAGEPGAVARSLAERVLERSIRPEKGTASESVAEAPGSITEPSMAATTDQ